jgi:hypothetical protein
MRLRCCSVLGSRQRGPSQPEYMSTLCRNWQLKCPRLPLLVFYNVNNLSCVVHPLFHQGPKLFGTDYFYSRQRYSTVAILSIQAAQVQTDHSGKEAVWSPLVGACPYIYRAVRVVNGSCHRTVHYTGQNPGQRKGTRDFRALLILIPGL